MSDTSEKQGQEQLQVQQQQKQQQQLQQPQEGAAASSSSSAPPTQSKEAALEASSIQTLISIVRLACTRADIEKQKIRDIQREISLLKNTMLELFMEEHMTKSFRRRINFYLGRVQQDIKQLEVLCSDFDKVKPPAVKISELPTAENVEEKADTETTSDEDGEDSNGNTVSTTTTSATQDTEADLVEGAAGPSSEAGGQETQSAEAASPKSVAHQAYLTILSRLINHAETVSGLLGPEETMELEAETVAVVEELLSFIMFLQEQKRQLIFHPKVTWVPPPTPVQLEPPEAPVPSESRFGSFLRRVFCCCCSRDATPGN